MKCPKCGYYRQTRDNAFVPATECPACGVVYSKHDEESLEPASMGVVSPPLLKPSPVDAVSLKKARDRVEKRLRKQLEKKLKDERHEKTLELARRITEQEVRKRLELYKRTDDAAEKGEPSIPKDADILADVHTETTILAAEELASDPPIEAQVESAEQPGPKRHLSRKLMRLHPSIAWMILIAGVVGAILSWTTIGDVEAGVTLSVPESQGSMPLGLLLGFVYLTTGALGFAFFWVSSLISRQLTDIRRLLLLKPMSAIFEENPADQPQPSPDDG
jgi:hypothetical protein